MDSALRPRDIQARVRAGESIEEVARAAGVPIERVEPFAAPVIAERQHVAGLALANPVRRRGESSSHRLLRTAATESLVARGIDPDDVIWDAALLGDRRWQVRAVFSRGEKNYDALFVYDLKGRFSVAGNDDARWMIGEVTHSAQASAAAEPLPVDDELAIVRAIQPDPDDDAEVNDAYVETELTEVDGVYDIISGDDPEMDALYDMLASFDEDSVKIYAGLVSPLPIGDPVVPGADAARSPETPPLPEGARVEPLYVPDDVAARAEDAAEPAQPVPAVAAQVPAVAEQPSPAVTEPEPEASAVEEAAPAQAEPTASPVLEPEQPTLVEAAEETTARKPAKKAKRASVPSWDEIMFGSPRQGNDKK